MRPFLWLSEEGATAEKHQEPGRVTDDWFATRIIACAWKRVTWSKSLLRVM